MIEYTLDEDRMMNGNVNIANASAVIALYTITAHIHTHTCTPFYKHYYGGQKTKHCVACNSLQRSIHMNDITIIGFRTYS